MYKPPLREAQEPSFEITRAVGEGDDALGDVGEDVLEVLLELELELVLVEVVIEIELEMVELLAALLLVNWLL